MSTARVGAVLALFLVSASCDGGSMPAQVLVHVDADETVQAEAAHLQVRVFGGDATVAVPTEVVFDGVHGRPSMRCRRGRLHPRRLSAGKCPNVIFTLTFAP